MFNPAALFIGLRYTRAKRRNHFISFISLISILGIALAVMVLITVLSVMNGFDREIKKRVFSMIPPMTVSSITGSVSDWQSLQKTLGQLPFVTGSAPFVNGQVLLNNGGAVEPSILMGILPNEETHITEIASKMTQGSLSNLKPGAFDIVLGEELANRLGASVGDKITVMTPQGTISPIGFTPRFKRFTVTGIFHAGSGFGFDMGLAFIHLRDAQVLLGLDQNISGLHLTIKNIYAAPQLANTVTAQLSPDAVVTTWADTYGDFFRTLQIEKTMMFLILFLMLLVATFNTVSTLVMVVSEKESDIAILRTLGATPRTIMGVFVIQGGIVGLFGTLLGVIGGLLLSANVTTVVNGIQSLFHVELISSDVYYVNYLPSYIEWSDVLTIGVAALLLSLVATLYPAFS